jgi:hypothetical protein
MDCQEKRLHWLIASLPLCISLIVMSGYVYSFSVWVPRVMYSYLRFTIPGTTLVLVGIVYLLVRKKADAIERERLRFAWLLLLVLWATILLRLATDVPFIAGGW